MDFKRPGECGNGRQQTLLQSDKGQLRERRLLGGSRSDPTHSAARRTAARPPRKRRAQAHRPAARRSGSPRSMRSGKASIEAAQVRFETPDHHRLKVPRANLDTAGEALWIEHLE